MNYQIVLHDERKRFGLLPRITIFHEIIVFFGYKFNMLCDNGDKNGMENYYSHSI